MLHPICSDIKCHVAPERPLVNLVLFFFVHIHITFITVYYYNCSIFIINYSC